MQRMSTFNPDRPCTVHDRLNHRTFEWKTGWGEAYKRHAVPIDDGSISFDGLILDGWEPLGSSEGRGLQSD
jgi:hypothetical protein